MRKRKELSLHDIWTLLLYLVIKYGLSKGIGVFHSGIPVEKKINRLDYRHTYIYYSVNSLTHPAFAALMINKLQRRKTHEGRKS